MKTRGIKIILDHNHYTVMVIRETGLHVKRYNQFRYPDIARCLFMRYQMVEFTHGIVMLEG